MRNDPQSLFEAWAPRGVIWSEWAKPVLFVDLARVERGRPGTGAETERREQADRPAAPGARSAPTAPSASAHGDSPTPPPIALHEPPHELHLDALPSWIPRPTDRTAIVVDLPGTAAVAAGLALGKEGFRPVPLFNTTVGEAALLDVRRLADALVEGAERVERLRIDPDAPPAFLIDSERTAPTPRAGAYDNRWIVFPQDFPGAALLRAHRIDDVLVLRPDDRVPAADLVTVLDGWRRAGLRVTLRRVSLRDARDPKQSVSAEASIPRELPGPARRLIGPWLAFAAVALGLRRNSAGSFGAVVPHAASGSGFA